MIAAMGYEHVLVEIEPPIATLTLNRPKVLNALSPALIGELTGALSELDADVERKERDEEMGARELEVLAQSVREAEPVNESEERCDHDASLDADTDDVFKRHVDDGGCDQRLHQRREP